jgi:hypothetical protein
MPCCPYNYIDKRMEQMHYLSAADYGRCMDEIINSTSFEKGERKGEAA